VRALVVDDHPLMREAAGRVLQRLAPDGVIETAVDCEQGLALAAEGDEPDLVLLDLNLPGLAGVAALKAWRTRFPAVPVVVLSADAARPLVLAALEAGAAGYIPKSTSGEVMLDALRIVQDGGRYLPPELLAPGGAEPRPRPTAQTLASLGLTARQLDVMRMVAAGAPNKTICRELGLAERTVKAHLTAAFRALNVSSRTQLALAAARLGLGPVEPARGRRPAP
jgi:DNA-binding NarL/FixJ family response regulator